MNETGAAVRSALPPGWKVLSLGEVCQPVPKVQPRDTPNEEFTYIDISSIDNERNVIVTPQRITGRDAPSRARQRVRAGDIVLSTVRTYLRNTAVVSDALDGAIASTGFCILSPAPGVDPRYVFRYVTSQQFVDGISALQRGTSYPAVRDADVKSMAIPLAPPEEQRRIVAVIEEQFSRINAGDHSLERVQRNLKRMRAAVLQAAVTGRLASQDASDGLAKADLRRRSIIPIEGPELPPGWCWTKIADVATVGSGATPKRGHHPYWEGATIPWVTSGLLNCDYVDHAEQFITAAALAETAVKLWPPHTLLVAMYGEGKTRGKCSELLIEATTNQACAAIRIHEDVQYLRPFIKLVLTASYEANRRLATGGVQPNLSLGLISKLPIPIPPASELERILAEVERQLSVLARLEAVAKQAEARTTRLRTAILARAFSGRLVSQDVSEEALADAAEGIKAKAAR